jgi:hypothetical protein
VARWDDANKIANAVSALGSLAAVGAVMRAALRSPSGQTVQAAPSAAPSVTASRTGKATSRSGGVADTGVRTKVAKVNGSVRATCTGDADASGGGIADISSHLA